MFAHTHCSPAHFSPSDHQPFSLLSPTTMDNHIVVKEMISNHATNESFTFSLFHNHRNSICRNSGYDVDQFAISDHEQDHVHLYEHELFFDMDLNLPFTWGDSHRDRLQSLCSTRLFQDNSTRLFQDNVDVQSAEGNLMENSEYSPEGEEFEFHIAFSDNGSCCNGVIEAVSPADDLFYKGQLLPLHLPPRRQMVQRLLSLDSNFTGEEEDLDATTYMNNANAGYVPTVAELINEERHSVHPYKRCNVISSEDRVRGRNTLSMVSSTNPYTYGREDEHESSVFPGCYKDPALQMIQSDLHRYVERSSSRRSSRSSMGCAVLLPTSKRLDCEDVAFWNENCHGFDMRRAKEAKKRGFSMLKLRAPASFFKSLFTSRELGGLLVHHNANFRQYRGAPKQKNQEKEEEEEEEEESHLAARYNGGREQGWSSINNRPLTFSSKEAHERDKILKKAREYLQKYVKLFKSMYVLLSHSHQEQSRNLLESSNSLDGMSTSYSSVSSSSSSRATQGSVTYMDPKAVMKNTALETSLRSTSFSKRRRRSSGTLHASLVDCTRHRGVMTARFYDEGAAGGHTILHEDTSCGSFYLEVENPIQGAIAHCKQSSALPS